jgi:hypothetical protein
MNFSLGIIYFTFGFVASFPQDRLFINESCLITYTESFGFIMLRRQVAVCISFLKEKNTYLLP